MTRRLKTLKQTLKIFFPIVLIVLMFVDTAMAARIKDLSSIKGVRNNQLIGFGLVIGLAGTGDSAINVFFSIQSVFNMEPMTIKLFKTMSYESNDAWNCTSLFTDLSTGSIPGSGVPLQTWFVQKEGEWFSFLRENATTTNFRDRSSNGIGASTNLTGPVAAVVIEFGLQDIGSCKK